MVSIHALRRLRFMLITASLAAAGLLAGPLLAPAAHAEIGACYTDPVVVLSNGVTIDLSDTINDAYTDVQQVSYTIHAPAGVSVVSVTYTSGPLGPKETLQFNSSGSDGQYNMTSVVTTGASNVAVDASAQAVSTSSTSSDTASGWDNQQLHLSIPS